MVAVLAIFVLLTVVAALVGLLDREQAIIGPHRSHTPPAMRAVRESSSTLELAPRSRRPPTLFNPWLGRWLY